MKPLESANGHSRSIEDILAEQEKERGYPIPLTLESELLLKRIKDGGYSGDFLGRAFLSAYDMENFDLPLGQLINIDPEGMRLFYQILHIRHIKDWSDQVYNDLAGEIEVLLGRVSRYVSPTA